LDLSLHADSRLRLQRQIAVSPVMSLGQGRREEPMLYRRRDATIALIVFLTTCGALLPTAALAQPAKPPEPPPRFEGNAQAALLATTGNASAQALGFGGQLTWRPMPWVFAAKAVFAQTESDGELSARSTVAGTRADRFLSPRLSLFGQYDFLRDLFAGVEQRNTVTGGAAYRLVQHPPHRLTVDGALGFEHESRVVEDSESAAVATGGVAYDWDLSATSRIAEQFRYIQDLETADDWKLDQSITLTVAITSVFSLKVANIVRYANEPVPGFESTDTITSVALVWTVKRPGP
jgi:putative salt-induced outer membrane protein